MSDINVMRHVTKDITNEAVTDYLTNFYKPLTPELGELRTACEAEPSSSGRLKISSILSWT